MKPYARSAGPLPLVPKAFGLTASAGPVELHQTHIGWVYVVGTYAFKLKRPVKFDFLDFTSRAKRKWVCEREIQLNGRLCPDLYLGLLPVLKGARGPARIDLPANAEGSAPRKKRPGERIVDWAVWMKRLPAERMLDQLLEAGEVQVRDVEEMADMLSTFYLQQRGQIPPGGLGDLEFVKFNAAENIREGWRLDRAILADGALRLIESRARHFLEKYGHLVSQRAREGYVVDGHGDLRAENICLPRQAPPVLFDCIEFNDRFRICDSAMDVAYLAMDLDARGRNHLSRAFLERYQARCDQELPAKLLKYYLGYRAFVRAKVAAWIAADKQSTALQQRENTVQARPLFDLAVRYALQDEPALIVFCGAAGSGKSTLAVELARRLRCRHCATDKLREEIIPRTLPQEERYLPAFSFRVYQALFERAAKALTHGDVVILDGTFTGSSTRARAADLAQARGAPAVLVWADCPGAAGNQHLAERAHNGETFGSEATAAVAERQRAAFEKPKAKEGFDAVCRVDTSRPVREAHQEVWQQVLAALARALQ